MQHSDSNVPQRSNAGIARFHVMLAMLVALGCAAFVCGWLAASSRVHATNTAERRILYYADPMHPAYRSQRPGKAPDCGMDLEPVYAGGQPASQTATPPGRVQLTRNQEDAVGIQTETLQMTRSTYSVRTLGRVVPDEALVSTVSAGVDGWVRRVFTETTGTQVRKGHRLAAFYSRDFSSPQQAYVYALESYNKLKQAPSPPADQLALASQQLVTTRDNLLFLGMGDEQIETLGRTGAEIPEIDLTAPAGGQILERSIAVGRRFMRGEILYRIADLSRVWVLAEIYPQDVPLARDIRAAQIRVADLPPIQAQVANAPLSFENDSRTGKLRIIVSNERGVLVPGMSVEVTLGFAVRSAMSLNVDAVLDSGTSQRVFVALGGGQYELREVETGRREGGRIEIRGGLKEGERVVTAGAFLLDSETRIKNPRPLLP